MTVGTDTLLGHMPLEGGPQPWQVQVAVDTAELLASFEAGDAPHVLLVLVGHGGPLLGWALGDAHATGGVRRGPPLKFHETQDSLDVDTEDSLRQSLVCTTSLRSHSGRNSGRS
jgi:hypothetical protein